MRVALCAVAFNEERFIGPFLNQIPDWVGRKVVLISSVPWNGAPEELDATATLAREGGAEVVVGHWSTEHIQRNHGLNMLKDFDWVLTLDPDERLDEENWGKLYTELTLGGSSLSTEHQTLYWKDGYRIEPAEPHNCVIATRPTNSFYDNRCVTGPLRRGDFHIHHYSWARTDAEMLSKITHYGHAHDFDTDKWYKEVWLRWSPEHTNLHPTHPEAMKRAVPV